MPWFKKDKPSEPPSTVDETTGIDFAKYELERFGQDIRAIVDVPGALGQAAKVALVLPLIIAVVVWFVFSDRMAGWALVPYTIVTFLLALLGSIVLGGFVVARRRLDLVADASNRVVSVVGEMHADVVRVRDGHAGTSVQQVAIGLLENAVFPAVFGTLNTAAETTLGPLGRFTSNITKAPMAMVEKSAIRAIKSLPDKDIGQMVTEVGEALPETTAGVARLTTEYANARDKVEGIVATVSRTALGSVLGFALVATIPLVVWLLLGWLLT